MRNWLEPYEWVSVARLSVFLGMVKMTFEDINSRLPNGFHDAKIRMINANFLGCSLSIGMDLHVGLPTSIDKEAYRSGTLIVAPLHLFFLEPPDPAYPFIPKGLPFRVDGDSVRKGQNGQVDQLLISLPKPSMAYRFFLEEWNSFLYLAGGNASFSWDEGALFEAGAL